MPNLIGHTFGRYHILEQIGEGGMATVYKARDMNLERDVAVKVIRTERLAPDVAEKTLKRFEREAKSLARLSHANIVGVVDYGEYNGQPYLVMEYMRGGSLRKYLGKPIPWQNAVRLLIPIAHALDYAHKHNVIHRDVKPSNILLNESRQPMLADFGIAKLIEEEVTVELTGTRAAIGTPEYMSPEQGLGKPIDARTDIYALGVVLYEMVTGRRPFIGDTPMETVFKHVNEPLPRPTTFVKDLPASAEQVLVKALAKKVEERYQSMAEMARALEALLENNPQKSFIPKKEETATKLAGDYLTMTVQEESYEMPRKKTSSIKKHPVAKSSQSLWTMMVALAVVLALLVCLAVGIGGFIQAQNLDYAVATQTHSAQSTATEWARQTATKQAYRIQSTATARARKTATEQAHRVQSTATAQARQTAMEQAHRVQSTATAQARQTATANAAAWAITAATLQNQATKIFGPDSGTITQNPNDNITAYVSSGVDLKNFIVEVKIYNPSSQHWTSAIDFRQTSITDNAIYIFIDSNRTWSLETDVVGVWKTAKSGSIPNLNISKDSSNTIRLIVFNEKAAFYVNGTFIDAIDISRNMSSGDVWLLASEEITGGITRYTDFTVWKLP